MNRSVRIGENRLNAESLHNCLRGTIAALLWPAALAVHAAGVVENPIPDAAVSGISLISGWHCTATRVEIDRVPLGVAGNVVELVGHE